MTATMRMASVFAFGLVCTYSHAMTKQQAEAYTKQYAEKRTQEIKRARAAEMEKKQVKLDKLVLRYDYKTYGKEPKDGHSLYISMHGGGGAPAAVNDQQWRNQIVLYKPKEGIYLAPRAATNTWNLWHQKHIDPMFDRIIENFVAFHQVNPNKVYLTGYSAGGDGTYQLAPRMADRWAAAAMMAGHPNDAKPYNLNHLPFFIQCGEKDTAFDRNKKARQWGEELDRLAKQNPGEYPHKWIVYPQHAHWMQLDCKQAIPWMAKYERNPWPTKLIWYQDNVTHQRYYWLINEAPQKAEMIKAEVKGNTITLEADGVKQITLRLSDQLVNLDNPVRVIKKGGEVLFEGKVVRAKTAIEQSLNQRLDPASVATALLPIKLTK